MSHGNHSNNRNRFLLITDSGLLCSRTKVDFVLKHLESTLSEVLHNKTNLLSVKIYHFFIRLDGLRSV